MNAIIPRITVEGREVDYLRGTYANIIICQTSKKSEILLFNTNVCPWTTTGFGLVHMLSAFI